MATILIVDDRSENRDFLVTLLRYGGHDLLEAADGQEALAIAASRPLDLVITDLLMPTMDGFDLVRRLREQPGLDAIPVIFCTATYLEADARRLADACGVKHILTKPAEPEEVIRVVAQELRVDPVRLPQTTSVEEFRSEHLRLLSMTLAHKAEVVVPRLNALIDLSVELSSERDPSALLQTFCTGARKLLGARYALVVLLKRARPDDGHLFASGLPDGALVRLRTDWPLRGILLRVVQERRPFVGQSDPAGLGVPSDVLPSGAFAVVPVQSPKTVYGCLCLADRVGGGEFTGEETRLASTLAGLTGRVYENGSLYAETRRHVQELQESEERFRQITTYVEEVFWMTDPDKRQMLFVSPAYERIWGRSPDSLYEHPEGWLEAIHPDDRSRVSAALARQPTGTYDEEYRIERPDGTIRWIRDRAFPVRDETGRVYRVVGVAEDVSGFKRVTDELRESERRFRGILDRVRLVSVMLDRDGRITYCNDYLLDVTGFRRDEVLGRNWFDVFVPSDVRDDRLALFASLLRDESEAWYPESEVLTRDGDHRLIRWNHSLLKSSAGELLGIASIGEDITEQKLMEAQLRLSQKMEAVGRLAGGVAHDFNNILGVIMGYGEMLRRSADEGSGDRRRIDEILRAAERAAGLTRQLLAFSRKQVLEPRVLEPSALVADMQKMLGRLIGEDVELVLTTAAVGRVRADPGQLEQVIMNLAVNARDAMPNGGRLAIETRDVDLDQPRVQRVGKPVKPGRYVTVAVEDSGHGMDDSVQARLYEPFFTTKAEGKGTGLGLSTVYGIVEQSGGQIWLHSEVGRGTVFCVYLPRVEARSEAEHHKPAASRRRGTETVLVVEDEPAALELVAEVLRESGYQVLVASNGDEAVSVAVRARAPIHLLLTDVVLPRLSGQIVAERVRTTHPRVKVLFMSGYTDDAISHHGVLQPGVALLQKPFTPDELSRRVGEILDEG